MTSTIVERLVGTCELCGKEFEQPGMGRPRKMCVACSPLRHPPKPKQRRFASLAGTPFTVEHFRVWSERLKVGSGELFVLEEFQARFVEDVFAGFRECWLVIPEANGKTTLVALLALYHCEFRPEAWVPTAAASREQAGLIYRQASGFVLRNPELAAKFKCHPGYRRVVCTSQRSTIQIFAADAATGDGIIPTLALIDEPHRHRNLELYQTWAGKLDKEDAQLLAISTAGEPGGEFEGLREQFRQMAVDVERAGCFVRAAGTSSVLHEYAIPENGDPEDLALVKAANPASWVTVETLRAKRARPSWNLAHWRRFTCNLPTRSDMAAITEAEWDAARTDVEIPVGQPVWLGLDLGWKYDTTAIVPLWMRDPTFRLLGPATILEPPRNGDQLDAHLVEQALLELHERNPVECVVMDMTNGAQLSQWIQETIGAAVVDRSQGIALQALDYARFMEALREGWLHHTGDPGLTGHALNAMAKVLPKGDAVFSRPAESRTVNNELARLRVIDALVAAAMVHTSAADPGDVEDWGPA